MQNDNSRSNEAIEEREALPSHERAMPLKWVAVPEHWACTSPAFGDWVGRGLGMVAIVPEFGAVLFMPGPMRPFTTAGEGDGDWVFIEADANPRCKRRTVENSSDQELTLEIEWSGSNGQWDRRQVKPHSQLIIECAISGMRVRGPKGATGCVRDPDPQGDLGAIRVRGGGIGILTGPTFGGVACRAYEIVNSGPGPVTIVLRRAAEPGHADPEPERLAVAEGGTILVQCMFMEIAVETEKPDNRTSFTPVKPQ